MILLDKLRLINWHYFLNVTADIKKITFLTGANGTGKSTIISKTFGTFRYHFLLFIDSVLPNL